VNALTFILIDLTTAFDRDLQHPSRLYILQDGADPGQKLSGGTLMIIILHFLRCEDLVIGTPVMKNTHTPSVLNYKSLWLFWYIYFAMHLDIIICHIKMDEPKQSK